MMMMQKCAAPALPTLPTATSQLCLRQPGQLPLSGQSTVSPGPDRFCLASQSAVCSPMNAGGCQLFQPVTLLQQNDWTNLNCSPEALVDVFGGVDAINSGDSSIFSDKMVSGLLVEGLYALGGC